MKIIYVIFIIIVHLLSFCHFCYSHLCDNVFRQADKLIVKPENYNITVKDKTTFKIFLQNNMDRGIAEIKLLAQSSAFDFKISPAKMTIPKGQKVYFTVTITPKPNVRSGSYPINFRLVGGGRQFKSFNLNMQSITQNNQDTKTLQNWWETLQKSIKKEPVLEKIDTSNLLQVQPVSTAPKIDGSFNDKCWQSAAVASNFSSLGGGKAVYQTVALVTFDKNYLHFGFYCYDEKNITLSSKDSIQIMLSTKNSEYPYYVINLPAVGSPDSKIHIDQNSFMSYKSEEIKYYISCDSDFWTIELSLPFYMFKTESPTSQTVWFMRITRTKSTGKSEVSYWSADSSGYNNEKGFGMFLFSPR